jgi:phage FluMu protein Com
MNGPLIEKRCGNCDWLMFKTTTGNTRIEHKCSKCGALNIVEGIAQAVLKPFVRMGIIKKAC